MMMAHLWEAALHNHNFSRRLRATREALGLTPSEICRQAGIGRSAWSNWENGRNTPSVPEAIKLARTFDLSLDWLYLGSLAGTPADLASRIRKAYRRLGGL